MQVLVTFRHMDATNPLKEYAKEKVERITKYFPDPIKAHVVLSCDRGYNHIADVMITRGRNGVPKGIIFMTDGAANQPNSRSCRYAADAAAAVKARGIELFTIGFGVVGDMCVDVDGTYRNATAANLLADMASGPTVNNGCTDAENSDGDHFYCEPRSDSLTSVFRSATSQLLSGAVRLVKLP